MCLMIDDRLDLHGEMDCCELALSATLRSVIAIPAT